jgi:GT2 family glycosyltransferase
MQSFDIIILTWNGRDWVNQCLESLDAQNYRNFCATVVVNGSTDGTLELLAQKFPHVKVLALAENLEFCHANNLAAAAARREWVIIQNDDTRCAPDWLENLARAAEAFPQFDLLSSRILRMDNPRIIDGKGIHYSNILRAYQIDHDTTDRPGETLREVFGPMGASLAVRRKVIEKIGLFDERLRMYSEDVDFVVRARAQGYRCLYVPSAVVHHKGQGSNWKIQRRRIYFIHRNMELVMLKNIPKSLLWKRAIPRLAYGLYCILRGSLRGEGLTVLRAKLEGWQLGWKWRRETPPRLPDAELFEKALRQEFPPLLLPANRGQVN